MTFSAFAGIADGRACICVAGNQQRQAPASQRVCRCLDTIRGRCKWQATSHPSDPNDVPPQQPYCCVLPAAVYFTISAAICGACFAFYSFVLPRLPIVQQHRKQALHASPEARPGPAGDAQQAQQAAAVAAAEEGTAHSETEVRPAWPVTHWPKGTQAGTYLSHNPAVGD